MSLLALDPERLAATLPSLAARRRGGSWPVGLLPMEPLAAELARFGYRYKRGQGFTLYGATAPQHVDAYDVASTAALILNIAADRLPSAVPLGAQWFLAAEELETYADRVQMETHATLGDDYELAEALQAPLTRFSNLAARRLRDLTESAEGARLAREHDAHGDRFADHADALRRTARDVKASASAQNSLLKALRAHLPAPEEVTVDEATAVEFLASLDGVAALKRSDLPRLYAEAGSPGYLPSSELRDLAEARWGAPRKFQGTYIYRPAKATA